MSGPTTIDNSPKTAPCTMPGGCLHRQCLKLRKDQREKEADHVREMIWSRLGSPPNSSEAKELLSALDRLTALAKSNY